MSFIERVDHILFTLCGEAMTDASERHFIVVRPATWKGVPANAAFAICEHRAKRRKEVFASR